MLLSFSEPSKRRLDPSTTAKSRPFLHRPSPYTPYDRMQKQGIPASPEARSPSYNPDDPSPYRGQIRSFFSVWDSDTDRNIPANGVPLRNGWQAPSFQVRGNPRVKNNGSPSFHPFSHRPHSCKRLRLCPISFPDNSSEK